MHFLHQYVNYNITQKGEQLSLYSTIYKVLWGGPLGTMGLMGKLMFQGGYIYKIYMKKRERERESVCVCV